MSLLAIVVEMMGIMHSDDYADLKQREDDTGMHDCSEPVMVPFEVHYGDNLSGPNGETDVGYTGVTPRGRLFQVAIIDSRWVDESNVSKWTTWGENEKSN